MATLQQIQEAARLKREKGLTPAQAVEQVRTATSTANPPVTPPTPTATPPQTMQGVNGETFQVAPTNAQGISTPTQPTPQSVAPVQPVAPSTPAPTTNITPATTTIVPEVKTETVKPETIKTEAPIDFTQAKGREQDILKNLESFKSQNMTPEQIMKASGYAEATPEKKALIEPYLKTTQPTASGMFNAIMARQDIPDDQKTSTAFKIAQNRYTKANLYASMTPAQVSQAMTDTKLIEGSQAWEDLKLMNPKLVKDVENLRVVNGSTPNIFTYTNNPDGTPVKINNLEKQFAEDYLGDYGEFLKGLFTVQTPEQIRAIIYTPDVQQAQEKATEIELRMNEIEKNMDAVDDDVDKEMAGSGATASRIALEKASRKEKFQNQYNAELKNYTTYANKANNLITQNTAAYQTNQQQKSALNQALAGAALQKLQSQQEIAKEQRAVQAQKDIQAMQFENQKSLKEMDYAQQEKIKKMEKETDSKWSVIGSDANGNSIYGFVNQTTGQVTPYGQTTGTVTGLTTLAGQTDLTSLASKYPGVAAFKNNNPSGITWQAASQGLKDAWTQAGIQFAQGTARPANEGGNYVAFASAEDGIKAKMIAITRGYGNATVNQFLDKWGTGSGNIKVSFDKNRKVNDLSEQEFNELVTKQMAWESPNFLKEYESMKSSKGTQAVSQYNDQNIADLAYLDELQTKNPTQAAKDMKELGYSARDLANYKAGNLPLTEKQKNTSTEVMNAIKDLTDSSKYEWNDAVGKFDPKRLIGTQDAEDATIAINNLVAKMTLPNLGVLKGPMSDKDIQFIKEASTKLDTRQSNASFERNLIDAYNLSARRAGMPEIKKLSDIKSGTKSTVGGELDYSKYE